MESWYLRLLDESSELNTWTIWEPVSPLYKQLNWNNRTVLTLTLKLLTQICAHCNWSLKGPTRLGVREGKQSRVHVIYGRISLRVLGLIWTVLGRSAFARCRLLCAQGWVAGAVFDATAGRAWVWNWWNPFETKTQPSVSLISRILTCVISLWQSTHRWYAWYAWYEHITCCFTIHCSLFLQCLEFSMAWN